MTTVQLLAQLRTLGVHLWVEGGELRCRAPRGTLTGALEGELVRRKAEVLAFLDHAREACGAPHIPRVPREPGGLPLSFGQRRLWFLDRMQPGNPAYNIFVALTMTGALDAAALRRGLADVVQRHEALRTILPTVDGAPVQVVQPAAPIDLPEEDLRAIPHASRRDALLQLAQDESRRPFDLAVGPLCRGRLVRMDGHEHVLCWTMHHSIGDGWSLGVLVRDLAAYYNGARDGHAVVLPDLPIQYADYAVWQQSWLDDRRLAPLLEFWQRQLSRSGPLDLPTDRPRPSTPAFHGARHRFTWERDLHERLLTFSRLHDVTPFMTLLAALFILLARRSGQDDVVIGSPIANRMHPLTQPLIGFFVNTLALRGDLSQNPPCLEFLQQVKQTALGAYEHQELPFERLVESTRQARDAGRNPIFDVMFVYQNLPIPSVTFSGLDVRPLEVEHTLAKFDLSWDLFETEGTFSGRIQYRTDLYDAGTVARIGAELRTIVEGLLTEPHRRVRDLPLLDSHERRAVMAMSCGPTDRATAATTRATPPRTLHQAFGEQAARAPQAVAVMDDGRRLTYAELHRRSNALAWRLRAAGVREDACVGLWTDRTTDTIAGILGIWKAGGAYVPVDPAWPRERIELVFEGAGVGVIVAPAACATAASRCRRTVVAVDESAEEQAPDSRASLESAAYVMYTSGSTGQPNGVVVTHGAALNLAAALTRAIYGALPRDATPRAALRVGLNGPWIFDTTVKQIVQLLGGHTLDLLPDACRTDPARFLGHIREHQVDVVDCTPSQLRRLIAAGLLEDRSLAPLVVLAGGEAVDPALWKTLASASDRVFFNLYGPTECTVDATIARIAPSPAGPTIGRPLLDVRAYVLDPQLRPCPIGVAGELWIAGAGVARGYLHAPALTARRFLPDPLGGEPGARMYYTGDRARTRTTGELEYLGRADAELKVRGVRMAPQEVEAALMTHPAVHAAAVVAHARTAEDVRLVAYVTPRGGRRTSPADLRRFLRERVPAYLVPSAFVEMEALPLTPNGKLDRPALPPPDASRADSGQAFVAPRDAVEEQLAAIWARCLGLDRVGVTDDFFELGGHSLLAMIMLGCVKETFGCDIPIAALFRGGTIEQLTAHIRRSADGGASSPLVLLRPAGTASPFFCVHPVGGHVLCYRELVNALGDGHPCYGLQALSNGSTDGVPSVERMAAQYRDAVRAVQPRGPYRLGGWSLGGLIAFEMARQLQEAGEDVALVALIDSHATAPSRQWPLSDESILRRFAEDMPGYERPDPIPRAAAPAARPPEERNADTGARLFDELHARATAAGLLPGNSDPDQLRALLARFRDNLRAAAEYRPAPAPLRVLLLQAAEGLRDAADATFGWDRVALGGVERRVVPGNHYSIMRSPGVEALAAELTAWLAADATPLAALEGGA